MGAVVQWVRLFNVPFNFGGGLGLFGTACVYNKIVRKLEEVLNIKVN